MTNIEDTLAFIESNCKDMYKEAQDKAAELGGANEFYRAYRMIERLAEQQRQLAWTVKRIINPHS